MATRGVARAGAFALALLLTACPGGESPPEEPSSPSTRSLGKLAEPVEIETAPAPQGNWRQAACDLTPEQLTLIARGYSPDRSPDLTFVPRAPNYFGSFTATSHSGPWDYVQRVPIVFYGPGFIRARGELQPARVATSADVAPTLAELLGMEWPADRPSTALTEALVDPEDRPTPPRLIVTIVWDGGGRDVLDQWPDEWPNLEAMIRGGTSFGNAVVGSSPPVTPAVHATIGTGTFPNEHGIVDIPLRIGNEVVGSWSDDSPRFLKTETLADIYDKQQGNASEIAMVGASEWHLGLIGHGAYLEGGDHDFAVMKSQGGDNITNDAFYELPDYLSDLEGFEELVERVDREDGKADNRWLGNDILEDPHLVQESPASTLYQTRVIKELLTKESFGQDDVPDLLFTNYKQIDLVGHRYNMLEPEMREAVRYTDQELGELIEFLNEWVGEEQWVIALTADHGSTPAAEAIGAWPISTPEVVADLSDHFGLPASEIIDETRVTGFWLNRDGLAAAGISIEEVADFMLDMRIEDNAVDVDELPEGYEKRLDEHIFSAVWPAEHTDEILDCAKAGT